jgi:hypothetical protein
VRQKAINDAERDALYDRQRDELFLEVRKDKKFDHFANTSSVGGVGDPASGDEEMVRRYADLDSRM